MITKEFERLLPDLDRWGFVTLGLLALDQAGIDVARFRRIREILEEPGAFGGDPRRYAPTLTHCEHDPPCAAPCAHICSVCEEERPLGPNEKPTESGWRDCDDCETYQEEQRAQMEPEARERAKERHRIYDPGIKGVPMDTPLATVNPNADREELEALGLLGGEKGSGSDAVHDDEDGGRQP